MKHYAVKSIEPKISERPADDGSAFDVDKLLEHTGEILRREVKNLLSESSSGKLSAPSSKNLVDYIKLLHELKQSQAKDAENMTDEQLAELAKV